MSQIEHVTGTAFVVAEFRADENREAEPLYQDHIVELFLNEDTRAAAARVSTDFPSVKDLVRIRTSTWTTCSTSNFALASGKWSSSAPGWTLAP